MDIDPPHPAALEASIAHECDHLGVRNDARLVHLLVGRQQFRSSSPVADQEFPEDQFMPDHLIALEETVELGGVRLTIGQEANPDRRIDEYHHAARRFVVGFSRRRGTSLAPGSDPRRARKRS